MVSRMCSFSANVSAYFRAAGFRTVLICWCPTLVPCLCLDGSLDLVWHIWSCLSLLWFEPWFLGGSREAGPKHRQWHTIIFVICRRFTRLMEPSVYYEHVFILANRLYKCITSKMCPVEHNILTLLLNGELQ